MRARSDLSIYYHGSDLLIRFTLDFWVDQNKGDSPLQSTEVDAIFSGECDAMVDVTFNNL